MNNSQPLTVFLVDDDPLFTTALKDQVKKTFPSQTNIKTFLTGEECLQNLLPPPNIIILDYFLNSNFPNAMDGLRVLKRVMEISPETKVIILSSQDKMEVAVNMIKYGAYDYIIKNDNVFLRIKLVLSNAANSIAVAKELKSYKMIMRTAMGIIIAIVAICILIQIFFPRVFLRE